MKNHLDVDFEIIFIHLERIETLIELFDRAEDRDFREVGTLTCWLLELISGIEDEVGELQKKLKQG